jgi:membrane protein implicated in regulation of membrane protease activity
LIPSIFDPWLWLAAAAVLAVVEALLPGYLLLGFGIGAAAVALALFPLGGEARALPYAPATLLAIWSAVSLLAWFGLTAIFGRRSRRRQGGRDVNDFDNSP